MTSVAPDKKAREEAANRGREAARRLLQQIPLSANQTVLLARGPQLLAHRGELRQTEALDIAVFVAGGWNERGQAARVQFMLPPAISEDRLLYTCRLGSQFLVTFADAVDAPLPALMQLAEQFLSMVQSSALNGYN